MPHGQLWFCHLQKVTRMWQIASITSLAETTVYDKSLHSTPGAFTL